jgi:hypothetical protein
LLTANTLARCVIPGHKESDQDQHHQGRGGDNDSKQFWSILLAFDHHWISGPGSG